MKKIFCAVTIFVLTAALLAGCSGISKPPKEQAEENLSSEEEVLEPLEVEQPPEEGQSAAESINIEPEQLLSAEEVGQLLGEPVKDGEKSQMEAVGQKIVLYDPEQEGSFAFLQISLTQQSAMPSGGTITPEEIYGGAKAGLDETSDFEISGIGDDCFTGTPGLHILADGYYIVIGAGNTNDESVLRILEEASKLAVENLDKLLG